MATTPNKRRKRKPTKAGVTRPAKRKKPSARAPKAAPRTSSSKPSLKPRAPVARSRSRASAPPLTQSKTPRRPSKVAPVAQRKAAPGIRSSKPKPKPTRRPQVKASQVSARTLARRAKAAREEALRLHRNELARRRYLEKKSIEAGLEATRLEKLARARARRFAKKRGQVDERDLARGWLERIRDDLAPLYPVSLEVTYAGGGSADMKDPHDIQASSRSLWLAVGRFDFTEELDYQRFAHALEIIASDLTLEAMVNPQRLSQIRVIWADPDSKRHESDCVLSKIGAWEYVISDLIGEIIGSGRQGGDDDADATSLAGRYQQTTVSTFYVFFSSTVTRYVTAAPWMNKTQTVKIR